MSVDIQTNNQGEEGRRVVVLTAGFAVLVLALLLIAFGGTLLGGELSDQNGGLAAPAAESSVAQFPAEGPPLQVGDQPYEFVLDDLQGDPVALSEFGGRPVLINFWATWCGPCRIEMPELQAAYETYQDEGLVVLALDQDESPGEVAAFFEEFGLTFTPLLDEGSQTAHNYGLQGTLPTSVFVNGEGEITIIHRGPMVREQIDSYLAQTIPGLAAGTS